MKKCFPILLFALIALVQCHKKPETLFVLKTPEQTGISFSNVITETDSFNILTYEYIYNGAGVGIADFNNDGLQDIFFSGNEVPNKLYLNQGNFRFKDVSGKANINSPGKWNSGIAVVDINNDGFMDIFVCATAKPDKEDRKDMLFVHQGLDNDGNPTFKEMAAEYGVDYDGHSIMAAFFDYDLDGDLDLYTLVNQKLTNVPTNYRPKITDGSSPNNDRLFRNNGDGTFTDVTLEAGIVYEGFGLGLSIADFDKDGWPDVYVSNDFLSSDILYLNQRNGTFKNVTPEFITHQSQFSMGNDAADINNDGMSDIITLDMLPETNDRKKTTIGNKNYLTYLNNEKFGYEYQHVRNMLHLNNGLGQGIKFSEIGMMSGVYQTEWSWSALFADFDNDGHKDLAITNGFPKDITDKDFANYRANVGHLASARMLVDSIPIIKIRNYMYKNNGDLSFSDVTKTWGLDQPSFSNGAAFVDLDNDGDLDYVVNNINDPAFVFENTLINKQKSSAGNRSNFLRIKLKGSGPNINAIGAKTTVYYEGGNKQYHENYSYRGFLSSVEGIVHFGLGTTQSVDSVEVIWPDGTRQTERNVPLNTVMEIAYSPVSSNTHQQKIKTLFTQVPDNLGINFKHEETDQIDYNFQRTIPRKFSQQGPGISVEDINHDGLEDFIIGGSAGKELTVYLQSSDQTFKSVKFKKSSSGEEEDLGMLLFDANNDGYKDLYVVSGSFEYPKDGQQYQDRLYLNDKSGNFILQENALPAFTSSGSCVRAADFDKDGDLDLFVGGRVVPQHYPLPASSFILRNDNGIFKDITKEVCPVLENLGMVTDALWTDFDGDGATDLMVVGEFMPLSFFRNDGGKLVKHEEAAFKNYSGWWNGIVAGDFDKDGDTDYVVGNLGMNNPFNASREYPVKVIAKDFDGNGSIDPILACYMKESMTSEERKLFPVHFWDELNSQSPKFRNKFSRYAQYSKVTVEQLLTSDEWQDALVLEANYFASAYVENLGNGKFEVHALPREAQIAPLYGMVVADINNDSNPDIVMVGNDYGHEVFIGRYDALTGLVLLGDGQGAFEAVPSARSGFYVCGDAKSLVSIIQPGQWIYLAGQNRDSLQVFVHQVPQGQKVFSPQTMDSHAVLTFTNGDTQRIEFYHGAGYLSQSTRRIVIPQHVQTIKVYNYKGEERILNPESML